MKINGCDGSFEGTLKNLAALSSLFTKVEQLEVADRILTEKFENAKAKLHRIRNEIPLDYIGPTKGIVLYLHDYCDPLRLEFDRELFVQEFVKSQFAGVPTHVRLISLLRGIEEFFEVFKVYDEGEYWDTGGEAVLDQHIRRCSDVIAEFAAKNPRAQFKVKGPDGRLIDMVE